MSDHPTGKPEEPNEPDLGELLRSIMSGEGLAGHPEFADALKSMGIDRLDPATMGMLKAQMQAMMSGPPDGGFDIAMATDIARKQVAGGADQSISARTKADTEQIVQVANLWLDDVTDFSAVGPGLAWSRAEWVDQTMPMWRRLVEPVAAGVGNAIQHAMREQLGQPGDGAAEQLGLPAGMDTSAMMGQIEPMMARMSNAMFAMQVGQAVGALAADLVSGAEIGIPLLEGDQVVLLPTNVAAFAEGQSVDAGEVHLYVAVREAARMRLFKAVPWLSPALIAAVQSYAGDISIDTEAIERSLRDIDPTNPEAMQTALQGSLFTPEPSEAQRRALAHLETLLALVEGWVDVVSDRAADGHLPHASALSEAVRRRRASGGPAERVFSSLVGLDLRPRRLRDAAGLFSALEDAAGPDARDTSWKHPDFAPTAADLDDPQAYVARRTGTQTPAPRDDMDAALDALLAQGEAEWEGKQPPTSGPGGTPGLGFSGPDPQVPAPETDSTGEKEPPIDDEDPGAPKT